MRREKDEKEKRRRAGERREEEEEDTTGVVRRQQIRSDELLRRSHPGRWSHLQAAEGLAEVPHAAPLSCCVLWGGLTPHSLCLDNGGRSQIRAGTTITGLQEPEKECSRSLYCLAVPVKPAQTGPRRQGTHPVPGLAAPPAGVVTELQLQVLCAGALVQLLADGLETFQRLLGHLGSSAGKGSCGGTS